MKIIGLDMTNIKGFNKKTSIGFSDKMNVFVGPNNSGKSTILNGILLLQQNVSLQAKDISYGKGRGDIKILFKDPGKYFVGSNASVGLNLWTYFEQSITFSP